MNLRLRMGGWWMRAFEVVGWFGVWIGEKGSHIR